jgi:hypothetical protein
MVSATTADKSDSTALVRRDGKGGGKKGEIFPDRILGKAGSGMPPSSGRDTESRWGVSREKTSDSRWKGRWRPKTRKAQRGMIFGMTK